MPAHLDGGAGTQRGVRMEAVEILFVDTDVVACDGGDGPLGHPRVYLHMTDAGEVTCPYCGRRYVREEAAVAGGRH